ncbi:hypothetical protein IJL65_03280 [bacterium]|nr:hypothetical protein [bacterium]
MVSEKIRNNVLFKDLDIVEHRHGIVHVHSNFLNDFSGRVTTLMEYILDEKEDQKVVFIAHLPGEGFNCVMKFEENIFFEEKTDFEEETF